MKRNTRKTPVNFLTVLLISTFDVGVLYAARSSNKAMTSFSIAGAAGTIDEKTISVDLTNLALFARIDALMASFKTNGNAVQVGSKNQVSGKTATDFTKPVLYAVIAADGSTGNYTVRVLVSKLLPSRATATPSSSGATAVSGGRGATAMVSLGMAPP